MSNFLPDFRVSRHLTEVRFGAGSAIDVAAEMERLGATRTVVVTTPSRVALGDRIASVLGMHLSGTFPGACPQGPREVTEAALEALKGHGAGSILSAGGGSAIGLGKILAVRTGLPHVALPTTYAGTEWIPALEESLAGTPLRTPERRAVPDVVVYDPDLSRGLPWPVTRSGALGALAHAIDALVAPGRTPLTRLAAKEALWVIASVLPVLQDDPTARDARAEAMYAAWLAGVSRADPTGAAGASLQCRLVDALSGVRGWSASDLHAVLLPYTVAHTARSAGDLLAPVRDIFGDLLGEGLRDFTRALGGPVSLGALGVARADLERAADIATGAPGPGRIPRAGLMVLLEAALEGHAPECRAPANAPAGTAGAA